MKTNSKLLIGILLSFSIGYVLYQALTSGYLITFVGNIYYLLFSLIVLIVFVWLLIKGIRFLLKK